MVTEFSLLTWGGRTGDSVTLSNATPCVGVSVASHLLADGTAVCFTTTGGLPTGLTVAGTAPTTNIYYARVTGVTTPTTNFHLYDTLAHALDTANTTGRINTSSAGSGTHTMWGSYWYNLDTAGRARYGTAGSERVYLSMHNFIAGRAAIASFAKAEVVEIEGCWYDVISTYIDTTMYGFYSLTFTTEINGSFGSGFHNKNLATGYRIKSVGVPQCYSFGSQLNGVLNGIHIIQGNGASSPVAQSTGLVVKNCIISSPNTGGQGLQSAAGCLYVNNIIYNCPSYGLALYGYQSGATLINNLVIGCGVGIQGITSYVNTVIGNVSVGNTTNWGTTPTGGLWSFNGGATGNTIWTTSGESNVTGITSADFKNFDPATPAFNSLTDFSPSGDSVAHTSSSKLVDIMSQFLPIIPSVDMDNSVRPSYKNGAATNLDIGPIEFDWGYGASPSSVTILINSIITGSRIRIEKNSNNSEIMNQVESGGIATMTYTYTGDVPVTITIRKAGYQEWRAAGTITINGLTLTAGQAVDQTF